ncbi:diguanylate cyclase [Halarcobacter ebronensis]|uniref:REC domain-containing diguanylate cyclase n=1 Tax=Halarcobacter ebronensis TaxID=1462615 RepID=A0A4Q1ARD6_9BACT|nr:diguanylate cyclase [Halarcobacter ebronensis]QKF81170.1 response regulator receiver-modulated diguanylate cyclase (PAS domain) [Halarcobacter ebronensis]RXK03255.1 hypothetical protein CRV07_12755 [Halarcobacter ebronensis]
MKEINKDILKNATILYVEDEELIRDEVEYFLSKYVKKLYTAANGEEGLKLFDEVKPDIVITDIQMPVMSGLEMIKSMNRRGLSIIVTTAYSDIDFFLEAIELKVDKFMIKPIDLSELLSTISDFLNTSSLQNRLFENEKLLDIINENVLISITDKEGVIVDVSSAFCHFVGYEKSELIGKTHSILKHEDNPDSLYRHMWDTIKAGNIFKAEIKNKCRGDKVSWSKITITPILKNGEIENYIAIRQDITNKKRLEELSIHDDMTGLYNRRFLNTMIDKELRRIKREDSTLSLLTIDVDYFKKYNDTYGHPSGDVVLSEIAKVLKSHTKRATDFAFRMGGEEFAILFSDMDIDKALEYAKHIIRSIENLKIEHKGSACSNYVTISGGLIVQSSQYLENFKDLYKYSDEALYKAKTDGKNQVVLSDKSQ